MCTKPSAFWVCFHALCSRISTCWKVHALKGRINLWAAFISNKHLVSLPHSLARPHLKQGLQGLTTPPDSGKRKAFIEDFLLTHQGLCTRWKAKNIFAKIYESTEISPNTSFRSSASRQHFGCVERCTLKFHTMHLLFLTNNSLSKTWMCLGYH